MSSFSYGIITLFSIFLLIFCVVFIILVERKFLAITHRRIGPAIIGRRGSLQLFADLIKALFKELYLPKENVLIIISFSMIFAFAVQLICCNMFDLSFGSTIFVSFFFCIFLQSAFSCFGFICLFYVGYCSGTRYALISTVRTFLCEVTNDLFYLILLGFIFICCGGFTFYQLSYSQNNYILFIALFFLNILFFFNLFSASQRAPVDIGDAEGELSGSFSTEYSAGSVLIIYFTEYFHLFISAISFILILFGSLFLYYSNFFFLSNFESSNFIIPTLLYIANGACPMS